eukprot:3502260-Ditylum_brightwellii.AAC.1
MEILNVDITSHGVLLNGLQVIADVGNVQKNQVHCCNNPCASRTVKLGTGTRPTGIASGHTASVAETDGDMSATGDDRHTSLKSSSYASPHHQG